MKKIFFLLLILNIVFPSSILANQSKKTNSESRLENGQLRCRKYKKPQQNSNSTVDSANSTAGSSENLNSEEEGAQCTNTKQKKGQLVIGDTARATLGNSVTWSFNSFTPTTLENKYILRLEKGWENSFGEDIPPNIMPEELSAIAQVSKRSNSGIIIMEVIEIIQGDIKIPVKPGVIQISAKDGSPLKAELKQKEDSSLARDLRSVVAPGVEEALNQSSIPGVEGAGDVANRRLGNNSRSSSLVSSYFQLDQGQEVLLTVYDNFSI